MKEKVNNLVLFDQVGPYHLAQRGDCLALISLHDQEVQRESFLEAHTVYAGLLLPVTGCSDVIP